MLSNNDVVIHESGSCVTARSLVAIDGLKVKIMMWAYENVPFMAILINFVHVFLSKREGSWVRQERCGLTSAVA